MTRKRRLYRHCDCDLLTGICTRGSFYRKATALLKHVKAAYLVISLDISCFKAVNAFFRVETGDLVLRTAAGYMQSYVGHCGLCGRMESDHFIVCMPASAMDIEEFLNGLDRALEALHIHRTILFYAGICRVGSEGLPLDTACDRAYMAMNTVKGQYSQRYAYYDEAMCQRFYEDQLILAEMDHALAEGQFCVYFQPIYSLKQQCFVAAEALVRWDHPSKGMLSPSRYIPLFEHNGFIVQMDHFVWEEVCRFLHERRVKRKPVLPVSVNVSRLNFFDLNFFDYITGLLQRYQLPPTLLKLEVTESAYMDQPRQLLEMIERCHEAGIRILMDDFGSGYSSLNMLKDFVLDVLKVDRKFIQNIETSGRAAAIVRSVVQLADDLGMKSVMEGVETASQLEILQEMGCDFIQGFYFAKPVAADAFTSMLDRSKRSGGVAYVMDQ